MSNRFPIFNLLLFVFSFVHTGLAQTQLDSLLLLLKNKQPYHVHIQNMILVSRLYRESDAEKAVEYAKRTIALAKEKRDTNSLAKVYEVYAFTLSVQGNYPLALRYFNQVLALLEGKNDGRSQAIMYHVLAYKINFEHSVDTSFYSRKYQYLNAAVPILEKLGDHDGLAYIYYGLAQTYQHEADVRLMPIMYGPEATKSKILSELEKKRLLIKSGEYYAKSKQEYALANLKERQGACLSGLARITFSLGDSASGLKFLEEALKTHQSQNGKIGEGQCLMLYSSLHKKAKNDKQALRYAFQTLEIFKETKYDIEISMMLDYISQLYESSNEFKKALYYQKQSWAYQQKNYNENKTNSLLEIQNTYENQLKNAKIQKLESEKELAKLEKQQARYVIFGSVFVILALLIIGFVVYRLKEKSLREARKNAELTQLLNLSLTQKANDAELTAMRAEMNPHFVFNVMNSIQGLIVSNKQMEAVEYLNEFSRLSRNTLDHSRKKYIRLGEEIAFLKNYLALESLRFQNRFEIEWLMEESIDIDTIEIPPMLIQPFLENAIKHGLLPKNEKGKLSIHITQILDKEMLFCEITDNGVGRDIASKSKGDHKSMGISITEKRLELLNSKTDLNEAHTVNIVDLKDDKGQPLGTCVQLSILYVES